MQRVSQDAGSNHYLDAGFFTVDVQVVARSS
jgi:hypothetical protein